MTYLGYALLASAALGCAYLVFAAVAVHRFAARPQQGGRASAPVTLLKPLCGEDAGLYENLRSCCVQRYPDWQIVFGVGDPGDPAIPVVQRLQREFPAIDMQLVVDGRVAGSNLKVSNLINMLPAARHDILVLADSDMRVGPDYLAEVAGPLEDPEVGLVTCLYRGRPAQGSWATAAWSRLGAMFINHAFLPQAVVFDRMRAGTGCFGATIALRRETLVAVGGLAVIANELADDYALGAAVRRLGRTVLLSPHLVDNVIEEPSLSALVRHELRWARTIRSIAPSGFFGSILTHPLILAALAWPLGDPPRLGVTMMLLALLCRLGMVRQVDRALGLEPTPLWLVPIRDLLSFVVFAASFCTRTVAWRDRTFRVGRDGELILDGDRPA